MNQFFVVLMNLNFNLKMKKILIFVLISALVSCKTVKSSCDAYGSTNQELTNDPEFDIHVTIGIDGQVPGRSATVGYDQGFKTVRHKESAVIGVTPRGLVVAGCSQDQDRQHRDRKLFHPNMC